MPFFYLIITLSISSEAHGERPNIIKRNLPSDNFPQIKDDFLLGSDANFYQGPCGPNAYYYYNYSTHHLYISGTGPMADYQIGKSPWHCFHKIIRNVTINEGITAIGSSCFYSLTVLSNLSLPASVTSIGAYAFVRCINLTQVYNGKQLNYLGEYAFYGCTTLFHLQPKLACTSIKPYTFYMTKVALTLTDVVTTIEESAFERTYHMTLLNDKSNIRHIKSRAFYCAQYCWLQDFLSTVETIESYSFYGIQDLTVDEPTFLSLKSVPSYAFSHSMINSIELAVATSISSYAFSGSTVKSINIGSSLTSLELSAFDSCRELVKFEGSGQYYSTNNGFLFQGTTLIRGPYSCSALPTIPSTTSSIADYAFSECIYTSGLFTIHIPNSVTSIGSYAFSNFRGANNIGHVSVTISISGSVSIPNYAFFYCHVSDIEIHSATSLGPYAFACCSITFLQIPLTLRTIDSYAFALSNIQSFNITGPSSYFTIQNQSLLTSNGQTLLRYGRNYYSSYSIPRTVRTINPYAFQTTHLQSIIFEPANYITVSPYAFYECTYLNSIDLPNCVTTIGNYLFYSCSNLRSITLPNRVTTIDDYAFYSCSNLQSITFPDTITTIGHYAFCNCNNLPSITFPPNLVTLGNHACEKSSFSSSAINITGRISILPSSCFNSSTIKKVAILANIATLSSYAFYDCKQLTSITLPQS